MTSKARNQLASQDDAKPRHDAIDPAAASGRRHPKRDETHSSRATQREVAGYIEGLAASLRAMAHAADLDSLAYFLEMARLEASIQGERLAHSGGDKGNLAEC
ncbi:MAG TPA: hypothetical protein VIU82_09920 [Bosea sp. (in: a-proteobacteria)]